MEFSTLSLSKAEMEFNFPVGGMQPQRAAATPPRLQQLLHSINCTPPLAVQLNGCAWEGLCSLKSLPLRVQAINLTTTGRTSTLTSTTSGVAITKATLVEAN